MTRTLKILLFLIGLNVLLLILGGFGEKRQTAGKIRVGLVFDIGGLGDKSFNDSAYRGLKKAENDLGVAVRYVEPGDGSDRENALRTLADQGYELVIGVGFMFTDDMDRMAQEFPKTKFACIDYSVSPKKPPPPPNLLGLRFREHEGSFLVGALAGLTTKTRVVAFVGGMKIPLIKKFESGFRAGVKEVCSTCTVLSAYAGTDPKAFADPNTGREIANSHHNRGADIIYHASGKTGDGVFSAAKEHGIFAIGVDSDQFHEAPCCVLTSMVKNVDVAVFETIRSIVNQKFEGGVKEFGLLESGVSFVYDENNKKWIPQNVFDKINMISSKIVAGKIIVPYK